MDQAPFYSDVDDGPAGGRAFWLTTADGVRIRLGDWPLEGAKGTVLLFPGRTEYVEKYGRAARDFAAHGYRTLAIDWRGQGLADRVAGDPALGHVAKFSDYQKDVDTVLAALPKLGIEGPVFLLAHSMGGAIGLRALHRKLPVKAAAFTAPMWGLHLPLLIKPVAWMLSSASEYLGRGETLAPGTNSDAYVLHELFAVNKLTSDSGMYDYMQTQARAHPNLNIGGPTMTWLHEALVEMRRLNGMPSPATPCVTFLGGDEAIVSPQSIRSRMVRWASGHLELVEGARHEVMMESPQVRAFCFETCAAHFNAQLGTRKPG
jgi:lysophospholipase